MKESAPEKLFTLLLDKSAELKNNFWQSLWTKISNLVSSKPYTYIIVYHVTVWIFARAHQSNILFLNHWRREVQILSPLT